MDKSQGAYKVTNPEDLNEFQSLRILLTTDGKGLYFKKQALLKILSEIESNDKQEMIQYVKEFQ